MWIVARTTEYEHGAWEFKTYEEAKKVYDEHVNCTFKFDNERIYIAEVKEHLYK